jgi:hypothetical protein
VASEETGAERSGLAQNGRLCDRRDGCGGRGRSRRRWTCHTADHRVRRAASLTFRTGITADALQAERSVTASCGPLVGFTLQDCNTAQCHFVYTLTGLVPKLRVSPESRGESGGGIPPYESSSCSRSCASTAPSAALSRIPARTMARSAS